jgi:hypothetical protein
MGAAESHEAPAGGSSTGGSTTTVQVLGRGKSTPSRLPLVLQQPRVASPRNLSVSGLPLELTHTYGATTTDDALLGAYFVIADAVAVYLQGSAVRACCCASFAAMPSVAVAASRPSMLHSQPSVLPSTCPALLIKCHNRAYGRVRRQGPWRSQLC